MDPKAALAGVAALATAVAMAASRLLADGAPAGLDPAAAEVWWVRHDAILGWRALALSVAAAGLVAFAASFRERTWALDPERLWTGTVMVLAALGYAALTSVAAAVDLALLAQITPTHLPAADTIALVQSTERSLLVVGTPALVVVLLAASLPLYRLGRAARATAVAAVVVSGILATPFTWERGLDVVVGWFVLAGVVVVATGRARAAGRVGSAMPADHAHEFLGD